MMLTVTRSDGLISVPATSSPSLGVGGDALATNDSILVDGIIDDRAARLIPSANRDEVFEYFCFEQLLKFADLSPDEITSGWVDGEDDGGIDGFYVFINDHLLSDASAFPWPKGSAEIAVWVISCKHHDTFRQATLDKLVATVPELFDFSRSVSEMHGTYSPEVLAVRERFRQAYRTLSTRVSSVRIRMVYATRGDTDRIGESVRARADQAEAVVRGLFGTADAEFNFVGAKELIALARKFRRYSLELPFVECFAQGERYVLLSRLEDYAAFVRDEDGKLRRYLFDSNVRDFAGLNRVNEDIADSLMAADGPDFWWLNNGVTILVTKAIITGKSITMDDVQIVNGLQTTESIARYFSAGHADPARRSVLVKIIKTEDPAVRDAIIRATNNQTEVEQQSLHATDKIQRDIEEVLLRAGWYYDRRKNHYSNQGYPQERIVSPLYIAAGAVGLLLRSPSKAATLKQRFMRKPGQYRQVFAETVELRAWPKMVAVLSLVDGELVRIRHSGGGSHERFAKRWRHLLALIVVGRLLGRYSFTSQDLANLDTTRVTSEVISDAWRIVQGQPEFRTILVSKKLNVAFVRRACDAAAREFGIADALAVERMQNFGSLHERKSYKLTFDFLQAVDSHLPSQPWKPGVHREVARALGCSTGKALAAIEELVASGRRNRQKDGVVFDREGQVIAVDAERVAPQGASLHQEGGTTET